jgi:hypothetical protein
VLIVHRQGIAAHVVDGPSQEELACRWKKKSKTGSKPELLGATHDKDPWFPYRRPLNISPELEEVEIRAIPSSTDRCV